MSSSRRARATARLAGALLQLSCAAREPEGAPPPRVSSAGPPTVTGIRIYPASIAHGQPSTVSWPRVAIPAE